MRPVSMSPCRWTFPRRLAFWPICSGRCSKEDRDLFDRWNGAHPGDDGVEVLLGHPAEITLPRHRLLEHAAVAADTFGQHALEFGVGPCADALLLVRGDVGNDDGAERALHLVAALAPPILEILHAVGL